MKFKLPTRLRAQPRRFFREPLLVVQVLDSVGANYDEYGSPNITVEVWRDATVEDLA